MGEGSADSRTLVQHQGPPISLVDTLSLGLPCSKTSFPAERRKQQNESGSTALPIDFSRHGCTSGAQRKERAR